MPVVNPLARELVFKIVYYGPGLGGKTTTLQHVHATTKPEFRGKMVSLATPVDRTLYFDFLPLRVPEVRGMGVRLQLFTVPGQVYYNATRKLVLTGADGVVLVVDSQRARMDANLESLENLEDNLREHGRALAELPFVIQYNKRDLADVVPLEELAAKVNSHRAPAFETVATTGVGVFESLDAITRAVLADFERRMPESRPPASQELELPEGGLAAALRSASPVEEAPVSRNPLDLEHESVSDPLASTFPSAPDHEGALGEDAARAVTEPGLRPLTPEPLAAPPEEEEPPTVALPREFPGSPPTQAAAKTGSISSPPARRSRRPRVPDLDLEGDEAPPSPLRSGGLTSGHSAIADARLSFAPLFPEGVQATVGELEAAISRGDTILAVELCEQLVARAFARAAHLVSHAQAPRDPALVPLLLGLDGRRYLEFRAVVRDGRGGLELEPQTALFAYAFAIDAWIAVSRVTG